MFSISKGGEENNLLSKRQIVTFFDKLTRVKWFNLSILFFRFSFIKLDFLILYYLIQGFDDQKLMFTSICIKWPLIPIFSVSHALFDQKENLNFGETKKFRPFFSAIESRFVPSIRVSHQRDSLDFPDPIIQNPINRVFWTLSLYWEIKE